MNRRILFIGLFFLFLPFALVGCASQLGANELIGKALKASEKLDSYQFDGKVELSIDSGDSGQAGLNQMFETVRLNLNGVYQREPMQTELNVDVSLGQPGLSLDIPLVLTEEKLWMQIPALPIPQMSPEIVGKYIEVDLQELQDDPMLDQAPIGFDSLDIETQQKLGIEILQIFTKHYEETYFSVMDAEEAGLADDIKAEHVVRFTLTQDQVEDAISIFINGVLPDIHEMLSKPEWSEALGVSEKDLEELEELIEEAKENEEESLKELAEAVKVQKIELEFAINKDDHINYQKFEFALDVKDEDTGGWTSGSLLFENHLTKINEEQQFEHGIPAEEDTISYEQLLPMLIGPSF